MWALVRYAVRCGIREMEEEEIDDEPKKTGDECEPNNKQQQKLYNDEEENMNEHWNQEFCVFKLKRINQLIIKRLQDSRNEKKKETHRIKTDVLQKMV